MRTADMTFYAKHLTNIEVDMHGVPRLYACEYAPVVADKSLLVNARGRLRNIPSEKLTHHLEKWPSVLLRWVQVDYLITAFIDKFKTPWVGVANQQSIYVLDSVGWIHDMLVAARFFLAGQESGSSYLGKLDHRLNKYFCEVGGSDHTCKLHAFRSQILDACAGEIATPPLPIALDQWDQSTGVRAHIKLRIWRVHRLLFLADVWNIGGVRGLELLANEDCPIDCPTNAELQPPHRIRGLGYSYIP